MFFSKRFWRDKNLCTNICAQSCPSLGDTMDCSPSGSSVHGILHRGYWSGLPFSPPGDLPNPGIEPTLLMSPPMAGSFFTTNANQEVGGKKQDFFLQAFYLRKTVFLSNFTSEVPSSCQISSQKLLLLHDPQAKLCCRLFPALPSLDSDQHGCGAAKAGGECPDDKLNRENDGIRCEIRQAPVRR